MQSNEVIQMGKKNACYLEYVNMLDPVRSEHDQI